MDEDTQKPQDDDSPADAMRRTLEAEILNGTLLPGTRLEEPALARRFGVSRTPVREALHQLAATELVEKRRGKGVIVSLMSPERLTAMFEAMAELEASCGRLASRRMTASERAALERLHARMALSVYEGEAKRYEAQNREFHGLIFAGARSTVLADLTTMTRLRVAPFRYVQFGIRERLVASHEEHDRVVAAILQGAEDRTFRELHTHIMSVHDISQEYLRKLQGAG